jgi:hypothetical protein
MSAGQPSTLLEKYWVPSYEFMSDKWTDLSDQSTKTGV